MCLPVGVCVLPLKVSDLGKHLKQPNGKYFKSNYGRCAPLVIYIGTEATALSSKSIRLRLGHLNAVEQMFKCLRFCPLSSVKPRVYFEETNKQITKDAQFYGAEGAK